MAIDTHIDKPLSVPDRGIARPTIGFSLWLEYPLAGGLTALFMIGVMVDSYLDYVFTAQVHATLLLLLAAIAGTLLICKRRSGEAGYIYQGILGIIALAATGAAGVFCIYPSLTQVGAPHVAVRIMTYIALFTLGYWAWGCWLWIFAQVWVQRSVPSPVDGHTDREKQKGHAIWLEVKSHYGEVSEIHSWWWKTVHLVQVTGELLKHVFLGRLGAALIDPIMLFPKPEERASVKTLFQATGHRIIEPEEPVDSNEYDTHRFAAYKSFITAAILLMLVAGLFDINLPLRETPKGVLGGTGKRIARGKVAVNRKKKKKKQREKKKQKKKKEKVQRESVLKMFQKEMDESKRVLETSDAAVTADVGLPSGQGSGATAAGSPKGTKVGGKYYMFRVKHDGNWDANRRGVPALMREFTTVWNVKTNRMDQPVELSKLRRHSGKYFPVLLYITGNGKIGAGQTGIENLRWYLNNGGFLFADSSGGDFYDHFRRLMGDVFPNKNLRRISYDHTIFRGAYMPWRLSRGAPIFRDHPGPNDAQGIYVGDRLAVFYSGGDLGAAWAAVGWGRNRSQVELAFRMGINILTYAFLYGGEKGMEEEKE